MAVRFGTNDMLSGFMRRFLNKMKNYRHLVTKYMVLMNYFDHKYSNDNINSTKNCFHFLVKSSSISIYWIQWKMIYSINLLFLMNRPIKCVQIFDSKIFKMSMNAKSSIQFIRFKWKILSLTEIFRYRASFNCINISLFDFCFGHFVTFHLDEIRPEKKQSINDNF